MPERKLRIVALCILTIVLAAGCKKKPAPVATPPPPPPPAATPAPTVTLTANPNSIERGQSTTLSWSTTNATTVTLEPALGEVEARGTKTLQPAQSITYRIIAKGGGGTADATARVTVTNPIPVTERSRAPQEEDLGTVWSREIKTVLFDYDKSDVRDDQKSAVEGNGRFFLAHPNVAINIEGNCDERGSAEYNLGLGDRRANTLKEYLVGMGIPADRIHTISYGKEKPVCSEENESCWQRNRRGDFPYKK